jgi:2-oxo-3-hexenedioate decarboxylase
VTTLLEHAPGQLDAAQRTVVPVTQLPDDLSITDAYAVQHQVLALRFNRGEHLVGTKLGFTSKAKMTQMGVSDVIVGQLTDAMRVADGADVDLARFIHPRIEPEVAFRLVNEIDLDDPLADIESAVDAVAPALEIIDSRYRDFRFSLPDVIADNTSAAAFAVGPWRAAGVDVGNLAVELVVDGAVVECGSTAAILGHPLRALHALLSMARQHQFPLTAGQIVLAGACTAAGPFTASVVEAHVARIGRVSVRGVHG